MRVKTFGIRFFEGGVRFCALFFLTVIKMRGANNELGKTIIGKTI